VNSSQTNGKDLWEWRKWAVTLAISEHIDVYEIDWLLQRVANLEPLTLRLESIGDDELLTISISLAELSILWLDRINTRKPVQYLLGTTTWRDFELVVSPAVLIPRPETESTIEIALANSSSVQQQGIWVDLGTGSGAIAIALARSLPDAAIYAVDYSSAALDVARMNAARLGVIDRISFHHGSWWDPLGDLRGKVSGMLSNPPYIPSKEVLELQLEVRGHEPHLALDGGIDGLEAIELLIDTSAEYLESDGLWAIEIMAGQSKLVVDRLMKQGSYHQIQTIGDLAGFDRFVVCKRI
jgi:release factor glutamine methyltransferase